MEASVAQAATSSRAPALMLGLLGDERLGRLAQSGDSLAFTAIYQRYHAPIYRYCRSIVGGADDAADALQNTMLAAYRGLLGERREIRLRPWLFRIAHNESVAILRRRRPQAPLEAAGEVGGGDVAVDADTRERLRELIADVATLSERQRAALVMRELSGLDYRDIGSALGTSSAAAKQSVHEARLALVDIRDGRDLACASVRAAVSERDGRRLRGRRLRAHLDECSACSDFSRSIVSRRRDFNAFLPVIPGATAATALNVALGGTAVGEAAALGALAGGGGSAALAVKGVAIAAAVATVGAGTIGYVEGRRQQPAQDQRAQADAREPQRDSVARAGAEPAPAAPARLAKLEPADQPRFSPTPSENERPAAHEHDRARAEASSAPPPDVTDREPRRSNDEAESARRDPAPAPDARAEDRPDRAPDREPEVPDNLDDLLAGDLADLIDRYSRTYIAGDFGSRELDELIGDYTQMVERYTDPGLAKEIVASVDLDGVTGMLDRLTGSRPPSGGQVEDGLSRLIPDLGSLLR